MVVAVQRVANCSGLPRQPLAALATVPVQGGWVGRAYGAALPGTRARRARAPQAHSHPLRGTVWAGVGWLEGVLSRACPETFGANLLLSGQVRDKFNARNPLYIVIFFFYMYLSRCPAHVHTRTRAHAHTLDFSIGTSGQDREIALFSRIPLSRSCPGNPNRVPKLADWPRPMMRKRPSAPVGQGALARRGRAATGEAAHGTCP